MSAVAAPVEPMYLLTVSGPEMPPFTLDPARPAMRIGRNEQCEIALPMREDRVSRLHARFDFDGNRWRLTDLASRWGTFVNGCKIAPQSDLPLGEGDLIRISPWTFLVSSTPQREDSVQADEATPTMVRTVNDARLQDEQLGVLLESTAAIHAASDERGLAEQLIDAALRGTGMGNAAVLRPVDQAGRVQVVASRWASAAGTGREDTPRFSRSLLNAAATGQVAELQSTMASAGDIAQSIVAMNITAALCVPITLGSRADAPGGTIAFYLYLDSRGQHAPRPRTNAAQFCVALGRMASLAMANLKRIEIERRQAMIEADLDAAAATQRWILPPRQQSLAGIVCVGESRPGRYIGGDFFDLIELSDGRLAVALGDVAGKGVAAGVLMTATQGFLHALLREHGDVARALNAVNKFVSVRTPDERFVTAWIGVIDRAAGTLTYIDAGHGYALLHPVGVTPSDLRGGDGLPIGVDPEFNYRATSVPLPEHGRVLVVSDGIIEQTGVVQNPDGTLAHDQFGLENLRNALASAAMDADTVGDLFATLINFAGTIQLADDATAVLITW